MSKRKLKLIREKAPLSLLLNHVLWDTKSSSTFSVVIWFPYWSEQITVFLLLSTYNTVSMLINEMKSVPFTQMQCRARTSQNL